MIERKMDNTTDHEPSNEEIISDGNFSKKIPLKYPMDKRSPIAIIFFAAFQHIQMTLIGLLVIPHLIADGICAKYDDPVRITLSSSTMMVSGICTILVTLFGVRGAVLVLVFSLYFGHIKVPCPTPDTCKLGRRKSGLRIFQVLPVLFSVIIVWIVSAILTVTDVFPNDPEHPRFRARAVAKASLIEQTPWFYFQYPGQFGMPSFNVGLFVGMVAGHIAIIIESVGDYFAAAKACQVASPPDHAVNGGILMEGIGALISGAVGTGLATTSYTPNIALMSLTRTANRYIMGCAGIIMIILGVVGKFSAVLATIPEPAIGGVITVLMGMLVAMGLFALQHANMHSARNQLIVGTAIFTGVFLPQWVESDPGFFKTGSKEADTVLLVILGTPMSVGGLIAVALDNTARGGVSHLSPCLRLIRRYNVHLLGFASGVNPRINIRQGDNLYEYKAILRSYILDGKTKEEQFYPVP